LKVGTVTSMWKDERPGAMKRTGTWKLMLKVKL
jgi:hypothetical protein